MKDLILIPTYNEKANIENLVKKIFQLLPRISILVIDDNSPDGTANEVKKMMVSYKNLNILEREEKEGLAKAYLAAINKVVDDEDICHFITMDADGSHEPKYLKDLLLAGDKADLVIGSRYVTGGSTIGWPLSRKILSRFGNFYARNILGLKVGDMTAGFICVRRTAWLGLKDVKFLAGGFSFLMELKFRLIKKGSIWQEVPINFADREFGQTKFNFKIFKEGLILPWRLRKIKS